jgi:hypothetical protein
MAPAIESDLMGHLFDRWTSGLAQKVRRFSYPKIMDEIYGCGAECFPETLREDRPAHQRTVCQGIYCMGGYRMFEDGVHCVG